MVLIFDICYNNQVVDVWKGRNIIAEISPQSLANRAAGIGNTGSCSRDPGGAGIGWPISVTVREAIQDRIIWVQYIPRVEMTADSLTKALGREKPEKCTIRMGMS